MAEKARRPEKEYRCGGISASVWSNDVEKDGRTTVRHSISIQKRYRDENGNWQTAKSWFPEELGRLRLVIEKCMEYCMLQETADPGMPT